FFFSSRRRHTRSKRDWSSDVCSSDLHFSFPHKPYRFSCLHLQNHTTCFQTHTLVFIRLRSIHLFPFHVFNSRITKFHGTAHTCRSEERRVGKERKQYMERLSRQK